jgi:hypothetical protein
VPDPTPEALRRFVPWHPAVPDTLDRRALTTSVRIGRTGLVCSVVDGGMRGDFTLHPGHHPGTAVLTAVCDAVMGALVTSQFGMRARADDLRVLPTGRRTAGARLHRTRLHCVARAQLTPDLLVAATAEIRDDEDGIVATARAGYQLR